MSASLKLSRGRRVRDMHQLKAKISDLQSQYQQYVQEREEEIASLLSLTDLTSVDDPLLMGAFLFIKNKITSKDPIMEDWQNAGEKFLRRPKSKTYPCTPSGKNKSSKQTAAPKATAQSPQKQLKSGGE